MPITSSSGRAQRRDPQLGEARPRPRPGPALGPAAALLALHRSAGNRAVGLAIQRLVVTTEGQPLSEPPSTQNPFLLGTLPMAVKAAGEPVQHIDETPGYRGRATIVILGHGEPGKLIGGGGRTWDGDALVKELTAEGRGISRDTDLQLWSCYAGGRVKADPSLVDRVHEGLQKKGVDNVTVSGVIGTSWTNTAAGARLSGPQWGSDADEDLALLQRHYLVVAGLMSYSNEKKFQIKSLTKERVLKFGKVSDRPPETVEAAIRNLRTAGRLGPEELSPSQQADVVRNAVQKLDQLMSEDKDVMALVRVATTESGALQKLRTQV